MTPLASDSTELERAAKPLYRVLGRAADRSRLLPRMLIAVGRLGFEIESAALSGLDATDIRRFVLEVSGPRENLDHAVRLLERQVDVVEAYHECG